MENKNNSQKEDTVAAIGIGAMIVFIALILVAAVAAAVIIQTAEKLQQNAQKTGDDTAKQSTSRFMVNAGSEDAANDYMLFVKLAPGSVAVADDDVVVQLYCGAQSDTIDSANHVFYDMDDVNGAAQTTVNPGAGYAFVVTPNNCGAGTVTMWIHIEGSGSTYQVLEVSGTAGQPII